jgi:hypothetical protein
MTNAHVLTTLARERQRTLLAQAQAARWARQARWAAKAPISRLLAAVGRSRSARAAQARTAETDLVRALLAGDARALEGTLAEHASFNSPVRRYADRGDVVHLLSLIGPTLPGARVHRTWRGRQGAATVISAALDEGRLDGMVEELYDRDGRVREVTLMLRPHSVMMPAIKRMAATLDLNPLPSSAP